MLRFQCREISFLPAISCLGFMFSVYVSSYKLVRILYDRRILKYASRKLVHCSILSFEEVLFSHENVYLVVLISFYKRECVVYQGNF